MPLRRYVLASALAAPLVFVGSAAQAADGSYRIDIGALNDSGATGDVTFRVQGTQLTVSVDAQNLVPGMPHAQHVHGDTDGQDYMCPTMADDKNSDGLLTTAEGLLKYGGIFYALTTEGDTSKKSGLAVDRFPVADDEGNLSYERTLTISEDAATHIKDLHYVVHGIDKNGNDKYDDSAGPSELDPKLPQEATAPAGCGMVMGAAAGSMPVGGVETGGPGPASQPVAPLPLALLGVTGLAAAGITGRRLASRRVR